MADVRMEAGSLQAEALQNAIQSKLVENSWAPEESDTNLSEYITMMLVNGTDLTTLQTELANDLLGLGTDDPMIPEFISWLDSTARSVAGQHGSAQSESATAEIANQMQQDQNLSVQASQDSAMDDVATTSAPPVDGAYVYPTQLSQMNYAHSHCRPSGPKAMRNGVSGSGRGRGNRMLGQLNRQLERKQDVPDSLRRIKGAAGGMAGRINSHASRGGSRGSRSGNVTNGVQRMMNNGALPTPQVSAMNPMMPQNGMMGQLDNQNQMMFMQMMEMQAQMMSQMLQNGAVPGANQGFQHGRGGKNMRGQNGAARGRGGHHSGQHSQKDGESASGMDVDESNGEKKGKLYETLCKFNLGCQNPGCGFAHQSPAAPAGTPVDLSDDCSAGVECKNKKCSARHPSPMLKGGTGFAPAAPYKQQTVCKFYPNCTRGAECPFVHPGRPCRNGPGCTNPGCSFDHTGGTVKCRYTPCTNPSCTYSHVEGQQLGTFKDKVWTADGGNGDEGKFAERFAELKENENQPEELIKPELENGGGMDTDAIA
nr:zinc finger ccch domain-containing protein 14 [Quercus suber]